MKPPHRAGDLEIIAKREKTKLQKEYREYIKATNEERKLMIENQRYKLQLFVANFLDRYVSGDLDEVDFENDISLLDEQSRLAVVLKLMEYQLKTKEESKEVKGSEKAPIMVNGVLIEI